VTCGGDGVGRSCWREAVYAISGRGWYVRTFFRVPGCKQVGRAWVSFSCAHTPNHPISWDAYDGAGSSYSHACGAALTSPNTALRLCFDPNFAHSFTVRHRRSFRSRYILAVPASFVFPPVALPSFRALGQSSTSHRIPPLRRIDRQRHPDNPSSFDFSSIDHIAVVLDINTLTTRTHTPSLHLGVVDQASDLFTHSFDSLAQHTRPPRSFADRPSFVPLDCTPHIGPSTTHSAPLLAVLDTDAD
jgi:hypothetical protein